MQWSKPPPRQLQAHPGTAHPHGLPAAHFNPHMGTRACVAPSLAHSGHIGAPLAGTSSRAISTINRYCWHLYLSLISGRFRSDFTRFPQPARCNRSRGASMAPRTRTLTMGALIARSRSAADRTVLDGHSRSCPPAQGCSRPGGVGPRSGHCSSRGFRPRRSTGGAPRHRIPGRARWVVP